MNRSRTPWLVLAVLWAGFALYVWSSAGQLPNRVATHFGAGGQADGWMSREQHVQVTLLSGLLIPAFIVGLFSLMRYLKAGINIPHKDYWLSPERQAETPAFFQRHGVWFAGMFILFLGGMHYTVVSANGRVPAVLSNNELVAVSGTFIACTVVWIFALFRRFTQKPA